MTYKTLRLFKPEKPRGHRLLLIHDDIPYSEAVAEALPKAFSEIHLASTVDDFLDRNVRHHMDVAAMVAEDINETLLDDIHVLRDQAGHGYGTTILLFSGRLSEAWTNHAEQVGIDVILPRRINPFAIGLPPEKWSSAMFRKTEETHGQQATKARRDCHEVTAG
jgi:hypothetical protein